MKRTTKYVALDMHQATTVVSVRKEGGRVIARTILPTEERAIVEFFRGLAVSTSDCLNAAWDRREPDRPRASLEAPIRLRTAARTTL